MSKKHEKSILQMFKRIIDVYNSKKCKIYRVVVNFN